MASTKHSYLVPAESISIAAEIRRSRFIAHIGRARDKKQALDFVSGIRTSYSDAAHNCWAYVAGKPNATTDMGMSDNGEPHGTAGKPMLNILQHSGIGEIVAVVTRYFGGIKLGTGGLVRAYGGLVQTALKELVLTEETELKRLCISMPFAMESNVRHLLETLNLPIIAAAYTGNVVLDVNVPVDRVDDYQALIRTRSHGKTKIIFHE